MLAYSKRQAALSYPMVCAVIYLPTLKVFVCLCVCVCIYIRICLHLSMTDGWGPCSFFVSFGVKNDSQYKATSTEYKYKYEYLAAAMVLRGKGPHFVST